MIDAAIDDWEVSGDAMRITHREVPPEARSTMASIGYEKDALHELDRWESKRTTGKFGK